MDLADITPIYYDSAAHEFYYPTILLKVKSPVPHKIIRKRPETYFDRNSESYYHCATGEPYIILDDPLQFRDERQELLEQDQSWKTDPNYTPIYYDQAVGKFAYPRLATEEKTILERKIIIGTPSLYHDPDRKIDVDIQTGEIYLQVFSPAEFKTIRRETLTGLLKEAVRLQSIDTPIYYHPETRKFFYPVSALKEVKDVGRKLVVGPPPLR